MNDPLDHEPAAIHDSALIVLGGDTLAAADFAALPDHTVVIAADSGIDQAHRLGLVVDVAIGDFDSVSPSGLDRAERGGARVSRHPPAKNATDFELALDAAVALGVSNAAVVGGEGGRLDHLIANALLMAAARYSTLQVSAHGSHGERIHVVRNTKRITGTVGEIVTLLAVNGPATGVRTTNLLYPLNGESLDPGSSRGVSNELIEPEADVSIDTGVLLAVLPGPRHRHDNPSAHPHEGIPT